MGGWEKLTKSLGAASVQSARETAYFTLPNKQAGSIKNDGS